MQLDHERTNKFFFFFFMTINVCFAFAFCIFLLQNSWALRWSSSKTWPNPGSSRVFQETLEHGDCWWNHALQAAASIIANGVFFFLFFFFLWRILATWRPKIRMGGEVLQTVQRNLFFRGKRAHNRHISRKKTKKKWNSPYLLEHW